MINDLMSMMDNIDLPTVAGGSTAAVLAAVWYFARMIRKIVSVAISLCVVYVLLRVGGVDVSFLNNLFVH